MPRVNFREVADRFCHIDATFVSCNLEIPNGESSYSVSLYPWWEHPQYLEARDAGRTWGFDYERDAYKDVTVFPRNICSLQVSRRVDVIDWSFETDHPLLWPYEDQADLFLNGPLSFEQWVEISRVADAKLGYHAKVSDYVDTLNIYEWCTKPPFSFGTLPRTLFLLLREALVERGVRIYASDEPKVSKLPVVLIIDDADYIIADDFDLEVPVFEHKPEWFKPA